MDRYLAFVAGRARPNTVRATAFDLKAFFTIVGKEPVEVTSADVLDFITAQRGDRTLLGHQSPRPHRGVRLHRTFYNRQRVHSSLDPLTPIEYEARIHHHKAAHAA